MSDEAKQTAIAVPIPQQRERIVIESNIPVLDTGMFDHMVRIAKLMASANLVPETLNAVKRVSGQEYAMSPEEAISNCFLVVNQAIRWRMDPFAVAQHVYVQKGRVGYEGKLVAAVINSHPNLERRLAYAYTGAGKDRHVIVTGLIRGESVEKSVEGTVDQWATSNDSWKKIPDQMLSYRGAREWARRHMPEAILGVLADEELEFEHGATQAYPAIEPPRVRATEALREALLKRGEPEKPGESIPTAKEPVARAEPKKEESKKARQGPQEHGTQALKAKFLRQFAEAKDLNVLGIAADDSNFYEWTPADMTEINAAYHARLAELGE